MEKREDRRRRGRLRKIEAAVAVPGRAATGRYSICAAKPDLPGATSARSVHSGMS